MPRIIHREHGKPSDVLLSVETSSPTDITENQVLVRVVFAPIHHGDLLGVRASPAFASAPPAIPDTGRTPGFEGVGVIEAVGREVDPGSGLTPGRRVAFFPVGAAWSDHVVAPASSTFPLPDDIPAEIGAQILINTITALIALRAGDDALGSAAGKETLAIQTGASSGVGRLITLLALERGITPIRLVRSQASADELLNKLPGVPVFATETSGWKDQVKQVVSGRPVPLAFDGVGGPLLSDVAKLIDEGGTILNYGSLGGELADIRIISPRETVIRGVSIGHWRKDTAEQKQVDVATAIRLGRTRPELFEVAGIYPPAEIGDAVEHVYRPGKTGVVLLSF
jgi:NADPH:quinone reductase-like Zn-dependent oxidoreductase